MKRTPSTRVLISASAALCGLVYVVGTAGPALAACSGQTIKGGIGASDFFEGVRGVKMSVFVNNFGSNQHQTWRQTDVFQNSNNFAEVGWFTRANIDQKAHPFKTWSNNGELQSVDFAGIDITPRDERHNFSVRDPNNDNDYTFHYDGDQLGVANRVSIAAGNAIARAQSERFCNDDSLWAQFRELEKMGGGGNWMFWESLVKDFDVHSNPYRFCDVSLRAFDVKQSC